MKSCKVTFAILVLVVIGVLNIWARSRSYAEIALGSLNGSETVAHWTFDECTGDTLFDISGNVNHGVIYGATWVGGKNGCALSFDGISNYVEVNNGSAFDFTTEPFTVEIILSRTGDHTTDWVTILRHNIPGESGHGWLLYTNPDEIIRFALGAPDPLEDVVLPIGPWVHYGIVFNGSELRMYRNHVLTESAVCGGTLSSADSSLWMAGYGGSGPSSFFSGKLDEVRISSVALDPEDFLDYPVPVELTSLEATCDKRYIIINWTTASEVHCHSWEIHRSCQEKGEFIKIGELPGHGSTETANTYRWIDRDVTPDVTYYYKLKQIDLDGSSSWTSVVSAAASAAVPTDFVLRQNYPNPFNPATEIRYAVPRDVHVTVRIYNVQGGEVATLVDADQPAGFHTVGWNAEDLASGVYFCTLQAGEFEKTVKMAFVR